MARVQRNSNDNKNLHRATKPLTTYSTNGGGALAFASATHAITFHDVFIRHGLPDFEIEKNGAPRRFNQKPDFSGIRFFRSPVLSLEKLN